MGRPVYGELDKMPHLLVAGATGSGKSVCINSIITTLLMRTTPDEVKLLLIDPKKVEFTNFAHIPHLIGPVISDAAEASRSLKVIVMMMENRYEIFSKVGVRNITAYNEMVIAKPDEHLAVMPWVVVIIDELADLMVVAGKDVEASIQRITQLARAAGIHLIVATQRPSVDVITGIIKSNIPSRIAFAVSSGVDSRTILDHIGAERLLGYGDMLYIPIGEPASIRIQGVFVSDDEVRRVAEAASAQGKPRYDDAFIRLEGLDKNEGFVNANDDPLFEEVKEYVISTQKASTSSLQRRFALGYNRAARMIDALEEQGVIGPSQGSRPRDVYVKKED
jgi:S-DNA-T family DNA segregation ATPase FtsK/SpoIIIE